MDRLTVREWARRLGISRQAGYRAVERCGITVQDGTVDPVAATACYRARTRVRMPNVAPATRARRTVPHVGHVPHDLVALAQDIADILADDPGWMAEGLPHLVSVLAALAKRDEAMLSRVLVTPAVNDALELHLAEA